MPAHRLTSSSSYSASHSRRRRSSCLLHPLPIIKPGLYTPLSSSSMNTPTVPTLPSLSGLHNRPIAFAPNITPGTYVEPGSDEDLALLPAEGVFPSTQDGSALLFPPSSGMLPNGQASTANGGTAPARKRHPPGKRPSQGYIPRPPNAFMLFRADFVKQRHVPGSIETNHGSLSKIIGNCWRQLPLDEKHYWEQRAKEEKQQHKIKHPDYRFRPVHNKNKGKVSSINTSSSSSIVSSTSNSASASAYPITGLSQSRPTSSHSHSRNVSTLRTAHSSSSVAAAEEEERRCETVAQFLLEGKKGEELARAVRELDERRMVEREREALASASAAASAQEASEEREMGMGMEMGYEDDMNATGLMRTQQGWSIERSLDDSRPTSSRSQTHSRGQSPHPFFAMPSTASSTSHPSGFSAAFGGNMNGGFGSYNGFTGMGGMNGMGGNSQFNAGLMLRRPSSVPLPTGDWLASFHNGASSSHSQSQSNFGAGYAGDLAGNGGNGRQAHQNQNQGFMPISPSPIAGISFAAQQQHSSLLTSPLSSSFGSAHHSNSGMNTNSNGNGNGNANYAHGMLQRRPSSALASFASIDPSSFLSHIHQSHSNLSSSNTFEPTSYSSYNTNSEFSSFNSSSSSHANSNMNANANANANASMNNNANVNANAGYTHPIPRKSWTYNPSAVLYNTYETMPFLVDLGIENPYASKTSAGGRGRGRQVGRDETQVLEVEQKAEGDVQDGRDEQEEEDGQEEEEETAGEPDYTLFNDGFSFASTTSATTSSSTSTSTLTSTAIGNEKTSPLLRPTSTSTPSSSSASSTTSITTLTTKSLSIDPTLVDWSSVRDIDPGLTSAATTSGSTTGSRGGSGHGSPEHFVEYDLGGAMIGVGNGVNGMQFGEIDPLAPIQSGYSYHGHGHVNSHSHSHAQNHGHGHMHAHAGEVDPLSIISGDYSMAIDSMSMSMDPMGMGVDSISMSMSMSMDPMGMAMDGYSMEMLHAPKAERTGRVEFCEDE